MKLEFFTRFFLATTIFIALLTGCNSDEFPKLKTLGKGDRVLAFGDSLTVGIGTPSSNSYPSVLSKLSGYQVINAGVSGEVTSNGLKRLEQILRQHRPKLVILCHGGNDFITRSSQSETKKNLIKMIKQVRDYNAEVLLIAVPSLAITFGGLKDNKIYSEISKELKVPLLEKKLTSLLTTSKYKSDKIHLNTEGYYELAKAIFEFLKERKAIRN